MTAPQPLTVTIGGKTYELPAVGWQAGTELAKYLTMEQDRLDKVRLKGEALYELAVGPELWRQMKADGADYILMGRTGLAALAHFRQRLMGKTDVDARKVFDAIMESGIDPEALAAQVAAARAGSTTSPATPPRARTSSTKRPANTASTRSRKAAPSRGRNSSTTKRKT